MKDFAHELDGMPSITLENNVIHNNEGYGVILVKPGGKAGPADGSEGGRSFCVSASLSVINSDVMFFPEAVAEDGQQGEPRSSPVPPVDASAASSDSSSNAAAGRKWQFGRQLSRNKEATCSRAVQDLMEHQIFVSVQGNQFKRNNRGDFGIFFY